MKQTIHDAPGFILEVAVSHHSTTDPTVELFSIWPRANHPDPHRLLSLTLPPESLIRLARAFEAAAVKSEKCVD
jgi:hypothetical protein